VVKRLLELRPDIQVAGSALVIDLSRFSNHQTKRAVGVDFVAGDAGYRVVGVAALQAAGVSRLIQVAGQAEFVGLGRDEFRWIPDQGRVARPGVERSHAVAGLATLPLESALFINFNRVMGTLDECVKDVLMTRLAGV
jgi:hypothetical protein